MRKQTVMIFQKSTRLRSKIFKIRPILTFLYKNTISVLKMIYSIAQLYELHDLMSNFQRKK
jgi:hypothetical protein